MRKGLWRGVLLGGAIGLTLLGCLLMGVVVDMYRGETLVPCDSLIVPGCKVVGDRPSNALAARLRRAFEVYELGLCKRIIVCGGIGEQATRSEAAIMRDYLVSLGVPRDVILLDENSASTLTNMQNAKRLMDEQGLVTAMVISNDFHVARTAACARSAGITVVGKAKTAYAWPGKWVHVLREVPAWARYYLAILGVVRP